MSFQQAVAIASRMRETRATLIAQFERYEQIYNLRWADKKIDRQTISDSPRAKLLGAIRLLSATTPIVTVPYSSGGENGIPVEQASKIERVVRAILARSGDLAGLPIHAEAAVSSLLYGEVHLSITLTADLLDRAKEMLVKVKQKNDKAAIMAAEAALFVAEQQARRSPVLITVLNPKACYPMFAGSALFAHLYSVKLPAYEVAARYGYMKQGTSPEALVTLNDLWYGKRRFIWCEGDEKPFFETEHDLRHIPIAFVRADGSSLFEKPEDQTQPFFYGLERSGMWDRANLVLTTIFDNIRSYGDNPHFVFRTGSPDDELTIDQTLRGNVLKLPPQSDLQPLVKGLISADDVSALRLAEDAMTQSTMFGQALGQPLTGSGTVAFSTVALLSQAGRLPLATTQRALNLVLASALRISLAMIKDRGEEVIVVGDQRKKGEDYIFSLGTSEIPDEPEVNVSVDIALPQDLLRDAAVAAQLKGLVSGAWIKENILKIEDPDEQVKLLWRENAQELIMGQMLQQMIGTMFPPQQSMAMPNMPPGSEQNLPPGPPPQPPPNPLAVSAAGDVASMPGAPQVEGGPVLPASGPEANPQMPRIRPEDVMGELTP